MYLDIEPEKDGGARLSMRVADALKRAILQGRFKVGDKLPSNRQLAINLNISRQTVNLALKELSDEGYLSIHPRSGTVVRKRKFREVQAIDVFQLFQPTPPELSNFANRLTGRLPGEDSYVPGIPAVSLLPAKKWYRLSSDSLRRGYEQIHQPSIRNAGLFDLRRTLSRYLRRTKDISCLPEQIVVLPNIRAGKDLLFRLLSDPGDMVVFDEPCLSDTARLAEHHGVQHRYAFTDRQGIVVQALDQAAEQSKFIVAHTCNPVSGNSISQERINQLLTWAGGTSTFIVETDIGYEYQANGRSGPTIMSSDRDDTVIYLSDFSGSLAPLTSFAFIVFPTRLISVANLAVQSLAIETSLIEQFTLTRIIESGYFERWNTKIKSLYANRRAKLVHALTVNLQEYVEVETVNPALSVTIRFDELNSAEEIERAASMHGLVLHRTQVFYPSSVRKNEFIIDLASVHERDVASIVRNFAIELLALRSSALVSASRSLMPISPPDASIDGFQSNLSSNDYFVSKIYPTP